MSDDPTPDTDSTDLATATRDALLAGILEQAPRAPNATSLLRLAEAYAWAVAPDQPHGGRMEG